jgi:hypothetical protein
MALAIPSYRRYVTGLTSQRTFATWWLKDFFNSIGQNFPFLSQETNVRFSL